MTTGSIAAPRAGARATDRGPGRPTYDVLVIGGGVVGCAIARELAHYAPRIAVVEAASDVGEGTSKANTAILHTGFDAGPGTLESRLVRRGYELLSAYAAQAGIPVEPVGALLVAWDAEQFRTLDMLADKARANEYHEVRPVGTAELYQREPHLGPHAYGALEVPGESIICPWTTTVAYATEAVQAGVDLCLDTKVTEITPGAGGDPHQVRTSQGTFTCRYLVNAAGLYSDEINTMLGHDEFTVTPRRGELIVFDKAARSLVSHILLPVPSSVGKGILITPTVFGNVMLGPTAHEVPGKTASESSVDGLAFLAEKGEKLMPDLLTEEITAVYAGLRAATEHDDYQLFADAGRRYVCVGGIRSTGLTGSMGIAEHVRELLADAGLSLGAYREFPPPVMPNIGEAFQRPYQRADLIAADPAYGSIVCHCERVTRGEIRDAMTSVVPARTLSGLRRRTRAQTGRCQGFYCAAAIQDLLDTNGSPSTVVDAPATPSWSHT